MRAQVTYSHNPFAPMDRRHIFLRRGRRIRALRPVGPAPVIAILNGKPILRAGWGRRVRDGDQLRFVTLPMGGGGGGGGGGSNPLQVLLSVALFAFAPWAAGILLPGQAAGSFLLAGATAGIQLAGSALINALMPVPKFANLPAPSPTYTLAAQGNAARIDQAIPVQYGRLLSFPDLAAQPYWEYVGAEQFVYQLLCLGAGEFDIEEIRIEDTPISAFEEITTEIVPPGANVTLFPTAVVTSLEVSGQELLGLKAATWVRAGTVVTVTLAAHGYATGQTKKLGFTSGGGASDIYLITGVATDSFTVTTAAIGTSGAVTVHDVLGGIDGFVASAAASVASKLSIDLVLPLGLYSRDGSGNLNALSVGYEFQARQVDDLGLPVGPWIVLENGGITAKTVTPLRRSLSYDLATPGRYRVRAYRTNALADPSANANQLLMVGLRSYLTEPLDRGPVTLVALRMRATNNLSLQASRKVSVLATRKVPVWNGSTWSAPVATRSIAWAIADAARNTRYGPGLTDSRLRLANLLALDAIWTARGDTFNGRFDQTSSWWDAIRKIANAGRAEPVMQGGMLDVIRDGPQTVPVALFSMRNIEKDSFSIDYLLASEATADAISVGYFDATTWAPQRVTAKLPGSTAQKPVKVDRFGIDNRPQALREGMFLAACNRFRRRIVTFGTEMEGFIPVFGDLIAIQHDMTGWGKFAEAVAWDAATRTLTLSEPLPITVASVIGLRRPGGGLSGPWAVTAGADDYHLILTNMPDITPELRGQDRERTHVVFGTVSTWVTLAKVISAQPRDLHHVTIQAVTEDPSVHTAEAGLVAPPIRISNLPRKLRQPVVRDLFASKIPGDAIRCVLGWRPAAGADVYHVEMAEGTNVADPNAEWTRIADTSAATQAQFLLHARRTMIRVRGVGLAPGPWVGATLGSLIPLVWNTDATPAWTVDSNPAWST